MENDQQTFIKENTDFETRSLDTICLNESELVHPWWYNFKYLFAGLFFGFILVKGEIISWMRIQEMFRFQSFHMYGVIGSAIVVGLISILIIKKFKIKTIHGETPEFHPKKFNRGQVYGGLVFGAGWALTGACPGPLYAQVGAGMLVVIITLLSAIAGTWLYGFLRTRLPH